MVPPIFILQISTPILLLSYCSKFFHYKFYQVKLYSFLRNFFSLTILIAYLFFVFCFNSNPLFYWSNRFYDKYRKSSSFYMILSLEDLNNTTQPLSCHLESWIIEGSRVKSNTWTSHPIWLYVKIINIIRG